MICPHCGKNTDEQPEKLFSGFIAITEIDPENNYPMGWCIVRKEFWDMHHYAEDCTLNLKIPDFYECMESTYEYDGDKNLTTEEQSDLLRSFGFEIRPASEWSLQNF